MNRITFALELMGRDASDTTEGSQCKKEAICSEFENNVRHGNTGDPQVSLSQLGKPGVKLTDIANTWLPSYCLWMLVGSNWGSSGRLFSTSGVADAGGVPDPSTSSATIQGRRVCWGTARL